MWVRGKVLVPSASTRRGDVQINLGTCAHCAPPELIVQYRISAFILSHPWLKSFLSVLPFSSDSLSRKERTSCFEKDCALNSPSDKTRDHEKNISLITNHLQK